MSSGINPEKCNYVAVVGIRRVSWHGASEFGGIPESRRSTDPLTDRVPLPPFFARRSLSHEFSFLYIKQVLPSGGCGELMNYCFHVLFSSVVKWGE